MEASRLRMIFETEGEERAIRAARDVDAGIKGIESSAKSAGGGLRGMFNMAGAFATGQALFQIGESVLHIGSGFLMANANAEQAHLSLETVTGSAAKADATFKEIQKFAAATPFEFPELVQASINLESFGMKTMDWLPTIGDTAAAMGKSVDQVTQAVLDASTGEYERLKELGIKASIEGDKVKFRYMKDGQEIVQTVDKNNQELINSTIMGIWNSKYDGAMEKQSQSFLGRWSTLKDNINIKMQEMTGGIFGFVSTGIGLLNDVFAKGFYDTFSGILGPSVTGFLKDVQNLATGIVEAFGEGKPVSEIVKGLPDSWQPFAETLGDISDSVGDIVHAFQSGGWSAAFKELWDDVKLIAQDGIDLGEVVIRGTFKLASNVAGSIYDWVKNQLFGGGDPMLAGLPVDNGMDISVGDVVIKAAAVLGKEIWRGATSLVDWLTGIVRDAWNGDPIAIGEIAIIGSPALAAGIWGGGSLTDWLQSKIGTTVYGDGTGMETRTVTIGDLAINVGTVALAAGSTFAVDVSGALADAIANAADFAGPVASAIKDKIVSADWPSIVTVDSFSAGSNIGTAIHDAIVGAVKAGFTAITSADISADDVATVATAIGEAILTIGATSTGLAVAFASFIAGSLKGLVFGDADLSEIASGVTTQVSNAVTSAIDGMTELAVNLATWSIDVDVPSLGDFPSLEEIFAVVNNGLRVLGDLTIGWPNAFVIDFPTPTLGRFPSWNEIWNLVWNGLRLLGDITIGWPNGWNIDFPNPGIDIPFVGKKAGGGIIDTPLTWVGENGPELAAFPMGTRIYTNPDSMNMLRSAQTSAAGSVSQNVYILNGPIGRGAQREVQRMVASGVGRRIDGRSASRALAGARLS